MNFFSQNFARATDRQTKQPHQSPKLLGQNKIMSELCTYFVKVPSGTDIVQCLRDFTAKHNLRAAFLIHCTGQICKAKIRLAEATAGFDPIREVSGICQIESLVGTLSNGRHLHVSLTDKHGEVVGGHVFGPLVASGTVEAVVGECRDLSFIRSHDIQTGYGELVAKTRDQVPEKPPLSSPQQEGQGKSNMAADAGSAVRAFAIRLGPGEDIVENLKSLVGRENLKAAFIMSCVGSVTKAKIRFADSPTNKAIDMEGHYEIVSLVGTLADVPHLHIALSDKDGHVIGGHVLENLIVYTTAELVIGECTDYHMTRELDSRTGFHELQVKKIN